MHQIHFEEISVENKKKELEVVSFFIYIKEWKISIKNELYIIFLVAYVEVESMLFF